MTILSAITLLMVGLVLMRAVASETITTTLEAYLDVSLAHVRLVTRPTFGRHCGLTRYAHLYTLEEMCDSEEPDLLLLLLDHFRHASNLRLWQRCSSNADDQTAMLGAVDELRRERIMSKRCALKRHVYQFARLMLWKCEMFTDSYRHRIDMARLTRQYDAIMREVDDILGHSFL